MRNLTLLVGMVMVASIVSAQTKDAPAPPPAGTNVPSQAQSSPPVQAGSKVDAASVTGSTFRSEYLKFTYDLPKDWKAMDDAARMAANERLQRSDTTRGGGSMAVPRRRGAVPPKPAVPKNPAVVNIKPTSLETYSLMVASPSGVPSLESAVLPRINIWAHKRYQGMDTLDDHAQYLVSTRRAQVLVRPQKLSISGHDFVRAELVMPSGAYRSQYVTAIDDYLVGFEFHAGSEKELSEISNTIKSVKFESPATP